MPSARPLEGHGFEPRQQTEFAANPNYGRRPYADQLTTTSSPILSQVDALLGGTVHHITLLASAQASVIQ